MMSPASDSICSRDIWSRALRLIRPSRRWWTSTLRSVRWSRWLNAPASPTGSRRRSAVVLGSTASLEDDRLGLRTCHMSAVQLERRGDRHIERVDPLADGAPALDLADRDALVDG